MTATPTEEATAKKYYYIPIDDPALEGSGFTQFRLPTNGNGKVNHKMVLWNNEDKNKITYCDFYIMSDIEKSVKALQDQLITEQLVDNITIEKLVTLFRNECLILKQDTDLIFFKNGGNGGNGNGNGKAKQNQSTSSNKDKDIAKIRITDEEIK